LSALTLMRRAVAFRTFRCSGRTSATSPPPILLVWRYALSTLGLCLKGRRSFLLPLRRLYSAHEWFGSSAPYHLYAPVDIADLSWAHVRAYQDVSSPDDLGTRYSCGLHANPQPHTSLGLNGSHSAISFGFWSTVPTRRPI
jgi:hypothetical protein